MFGESWAIKVTASIAERARGEHPTRNGQTQPVARLNFFASSAANKYFPRQTQQTRPALAQKARCVVIPVMTMTENRVLAGCVFPEAVRAVGLAHSQITVFTAFGQTLRE